MNSNSNNVVKKNTSGRRKIEIKKITNSNSRQVTFSKRRVGLFRKASELCILTGAEVAIIVHSQGDHVFSFGCLSADSVIDRYINGAATPGTLLPSDPIVLQHKQKYAVVRKELEAEKKRSKILTSPKQEVNNEKFWWNQPIDNLAVEELEKYVSALERLKNNVIMRADQLMLSESSSAGVPLARNINANAKISASSVNDYFLNYGADQCSNFPYLMPYFSGLGNGPS